MKSNKTYILHGHKKNFEEIKEYLDSYYQAVIEAGYRHRTAHVLDMLPSQSSVKILDYGCGWAIFTRIIGEHNPEAQILGIDIDENSLAIAQEWLGDHPTIDLRQCSIATLQDRSFDYVISMEVIEHVHNPGNYLREINRVLEPGGRLIITLPNVMQPLSIARLLFKGNLRNYLRSHSEFVINHYNKTHQHIHSWDPYHFTTFVSSLGFRVEDVRMVHGVPVPYINKILGGKSNRYWYTKIPGLRNLAYRMVFNLSKVSYVDISNED